MRRIVLFVIAACTLAPGLSSQQLGIAVDCAPVEFKVSMDDPTVAAMFQGVVDQINDVPIDTALGTSYGQIATFRATEVWKGNIRPSQDVIVHFSHAYQPSHYLASQ